MFNNLISWIEKNGGYIDSSLSIQTKYINDFLYRGVYYKQDTPLKEFSTFVKIPNKLTISVETFHNIPNIKKWIDIINELGNPEQKEIFSSQKFKIILALLYEKSKNQDSFYYPYITILPDITEFYSDPIYMYLNNQNAFDAVKPLVTGFIKIIENNSNNLIEIVNTMFSCNHHYKLFDIPQNELKNMIVWAFFIHKTRAWDVLIPFCDMFNNKQSSSISPKLIEGEEACHHFMADNQFKTNNSQAYEIFINYGKYDMASLFLSYNFLPFNDREYFLISFGISGKSKFDQLKIIEIKKINQINKKILLSIDGPSQELLSALRIISLDENEYNDFIQSNDVNKYLNKISNNNERRALKKLSSLLLELKKDTHSKAIFDYNNRLLSDFKNKKELSQSELIMQDICLIKSKEYQIIEENLSLIENLSRV